MISKFFKYLSQWFKETCCLHAWELSVKGKTDPGFLGKDRWLEATITCANCGYSRIYNIDAFEE